MRLITDIVIHCTASPNGRWTTVADIDAWHAARGFLRGNSARSACNSGLVAIGYHHVIYTNGAIASGRAHDEVGAHARGHNAHSLGLCLVGNDRFSLAQWHSLADLVRALVAPSGRRPARYPEARVRGHCELPGVSKTCPNFPVAAWLAAGMQPLTDHTLDTQAGARVLPEA